MRAVGTLHPHNSSISLVTHTDHTYTRVDDDEINMKESLAPCGRINIFDATRRSRARIIMQIERGASDAAN